MSKLEILFKEIENLTFEELWLLWEHLQQKIKNWCMQNLDKKPTSKKGLKLSDFSFAKTQIVLKNYQGSLADAVIEERRSYL